MQTHLSLFSAFLHAGRVSFQTSVWRRPSGRAAPVPTQPGQQPSCSDVTGPAPGVPGRSQIHVLLLEENRVGQKPGAKRVLPDSHRRDLLYVVASHKAVQVHFQNTIKEWLSLCLYRWNMILWRTWWEGLSGNWNTQLYSLTQNYVGCWDVHIFKFYFKVATVDGI